MSDQQQRDAAADLAVPHVIEYSLYEGLVFAVMSERWVQMAREALPWWIREAERLRKELADIEEYGTKEINAAVDLRNLLARERAEVERLRQKIANMEGDEDA